MFNPNWRRRPSRFSLSIAMASARSFLFDSRSHTAPPPASRPTAPRRRGVTRRATRPNALSCGGPCRTPLRSTWARPAAAAATAATAATRGGRAQTPTSRRRPAAAGPPPRPSRTRSGEARVFHRDGRAAPRARRGRGAPTTDGTPRSTRTRTPRGPRRATSLPRARHSSGGALTWRAAAVRLPQRRARLSSRREFVPRTSTGVPPAVAPNAGTAREVSPAGARRGTGPWPGRRRRRGSPSPRASRAPGAASRGRAPPCRATSAPRQQRRRSNTPCNYRALGPRRPARRPCPPSTGRAAGARSNTPPAACPRT